MSSSNNPMSHLMNSGNYEYADYPVEERNIINPFCLERKNRHDTCRSVMNSKYLDKTVDENINNKNHSKKSNNYTDNPKKHNEPSESCTNKIHCFETKLCSVHYQIKNWKR